MCEKMKDLNPNLLCFCPGLLLRQIATDPLLSMYNIIIVDEVCYAIFCLLLNSVFAILLS